MEPTVGIALWVVLATTILLLPPLLRSDVRPYHDRQNWFTSTRRDGADRQAAESDAGQSAGRPVADGGRVCHNCGAYVEGDYLYCAECLMPKV